jgi:hypothetical protein
MARSLFALELAHAVSTLAELDLRFVAEQGAL